MKKWFMRLRYVGRRPLRDQLLLAQVLILLGVTRLLIKTLSFQRLERFLGQRFAESAHELTSAELAEVRRVRRTIRQVSPHTPWVSNCFPQAVTAKVLLRRRKISSTLYLGAAFAETKTELKAHAWLRSGDTFVTGGDGSAEFGAVASFA